MYLYCDPKKALEVYNACYKVASQRLEALMANAPFVEISQTFNPNSLTARLNLQLQVIENPEITQLKVF